MKILNKEEFLKLPSGVVYTNFIGNQLGSEIYIKKETLYPDWVYHPLFDIEFSEVFDIESFLSVASDKNNDINLDFRSTYRDGRFVLNESFAVFEKEEVLKLISVLTSSLSDYPTF